MNNKALTDHSELIAHTIVVEASAAIYHAHQADSETMIQEIESQAVSVKTHEAVLIDPASLTDPVLDSDEFVGNPIITAAAFTRLITLLYRTITL